MNYFEIKTLAMVSVSLAGLLLLPISAAVADQIRMQTQHARAMLCDARKPSTCSVGSATWSVEGASDPAANPTQTLLRTDVIFPEKNLALTLMIRANDDALLTATHVIDIRVTSGRSMITGVSGLALKTTRTSDPHPLRGIGVKVINDYFIFGLSPGKAALSYNLNLLRNGRWLTISIALSGRRPVFLMIENAVPQTALFSDVLRSRAKRSPRFLRADSPISPPSRLLILPPGHLRPRPSPPLDRHDLPRLGCRVQHQKPHFRLG
jgi:hypothetical protein